MIDTNRLRAAYITARDALLAERVPAGHWVGELSMSALSTATAVMALHLANPFEHRERIDAGTKWLADHQNDDGGWGDTIKSFSNISTTMLCRAALRLTGAEKNHPTTVEKVESFLNIRAGRSPEQRAEAIRQRYGKDRTFSVPILMTLRAGGSRAVEGSAAAAIRGRGTAAKLVSLRANAGSQLRAARAHCDRPVRPSSPRNVEPANETRTVADEGPHTQSPAQHPTDERRLP